MMDYYPTALRVDKEDATIRDGQIACKKSQIDERCLN